MYIDNTVMQHSKNAIGHDSMAVIEYEPYPTINDPDTRAMAKEVWASQMLNSECVRMQRLGINELTTLHYEVKEDVKSIEDV